MAREFHLSVVAPDRAVVEENATAVVVPGVDGYFGLLAGHVPLIAALRPGVMEYTDPSNNRHHVYVGGGFIEVSSGRVSVLADEAKRAIEIDIATEEKALEEARKSLRGEESSIGSEDAVLEIERALQRIKAARVAR